MYHRFVRMNVSFAMALGISLSLFACGQSDDTVEQAVEVPVSAIGAGSTVVADVGFATPESVLHDEAADVYLVSNINGEPLEEDGNGFISRLSPDGDVF